MSDDAAQDKTTEDEATTAAAQPGGNADTTSATPTSSKETDAPVEDAATEKVTVETVDEADKAADDKATEVIAAAPKAAEPKVSVSKDAKDSKDDKDSEPKAPAQKAAAAGAFPLVPVLAAFAAGVVLVAAVASGVVLWKKSSDRQNELDARDSATAAACDFGKAVSNYDAKNLDDYFKRVKDLSTGQWLSFFDGASGALKDAMSSVQAKSTLDEVHCAWESGDDNKAKVIVILTQVRSNSVAAQPDMLTVPGVAELEKSGGTWKVSNFDSPAMKGLGGPTGGGTTTGGGQPAAPTTPAAPK